MKWVVVGRNYGGLVAEAINTTEGNRVAQVLSKRDHVNYETLSAELGQKQINAAYIAADKVCHAEFIAAFSELDRIVVEEQGMPSRPDPTVQLVDTVLLRQNFIDFILKVSDRGATIQEIIVLCTRRLLMSSLNVLRAIKSLAESINTDHIRIRVTILPLFSTMDDSISSPLGLKLIAIGPGLKVELPSPTSDTTILSFGGKGHMNLGNGLTTTHPGKLLKVSAIQHVVRRSDKALKLSLNALYGDKSSISNSRKIFEHFSHSDRYDFYLSEL